MVATSGELSSTVANRLRHARSRMLRAFLIDRTCAAVLRASVLLVAAGGFIHLFLGWPPLNVALVVGATFVGAADIALGLWRGRRSLAATAAELDRRAGTRDRFATVLALTKNRVSRSGEVSPVEALALAECERFIARFPVERWTPVRWPRARLLALLAPALSLALLLAHEASLRHARDAARDPKLGQTVNTHADDLQKLADSLRRNDSAATLARLTAELEAAAKRMREAAAPGKDAEAQRKAALRELSALQEKLAQMKQAARAQRPSSAEVAALAAALERDPATNAAAEALRADDLAGAAEQLEKLLEQLKENGDPTKALEQLARAMQENAARLSEEEKTEVARQMQAAAAAAQAGQQGLSAQAMRRLAELLRRAGAMAGGGNPSTQTSGRTGAGRALTAQELQNLLNALEAMKDTLRPNAGGGRLGDGAGRTMGLAFRDFAAAQQGTALPAADGEGASGLPGGERDTGVGNEISGERAASTERPEKNSRLQGELAESGEVSDGLLLPTTDGPGGSNTRSGRRYRELYEALQPAAQEALQQEEIPLGSRAFVGRYFKSIRPAE